MFNIKTDATDDEATQLLQELHTKLDGSELYSEVDRLIPRSFRAVSKQQALTFLVSATHDVASANQIARACLQSFEGRQQEIINGIISQQAQHS